MKYLQFINILKRQPTNEPKI